jgi:ribose/xylose/arabinose/galactoside ABC-type transport system permease subunit
MAAIARTLITLGVFLVLLGGALLLASRTGLPLGRLPGDLSFRSRNVQVFFPLGTSLLLSVLLSLFFLLLSRFRR